MVRKNNLSFQLQSCLNREKSTNKLCLYKLENWKKVNSLIRIIKIVQNFTIIDYDKILGQEIPGQCECVPI